jgi:hypothetical protein
LFVLSVVAHPHPAKREPEPDVTRFFFSSFKTSTDRPVVVGFYVELRRLLNRYPVEDVELEKAGG